MISRTTAVLVAVAVVSGAVIAGIGLATRGSSKPERALQIDEQAGSVGDVTLGETRARVVATRGKPTTASSPGIGAEVLRYPHLSVRILADMVGWIRTDDPAARTLRTVAVGDPLGAVRATYRTSASCVKLPEKETEGGTGSSSAYCDVRVPAGRLHFAGNPIASITLAVR